MQTVYPASITKIMTAMLALKYGNMDETVTITQENVTLEDGSQVCGFGAGDKVTMGQLVRCLLVYSGNDAASAIAEHIGGTTDNFVDMMNSYAAQLGCTGTHFSNPHGLQDENHYTTPYDIYAEGGNELSLLYRDHTASFLYSRIYKSGWLHYEYCA